MSSEQRPADDGLGNANARRDEILAKMFGVEEGTPAPPEPVRGEPGRPAFGAGGAYGPPKEMDFLTAPRPRVDDAPASVGDATGEHRLPGWGTFTGIPVASGVVAGPEFDAAPAPQIDVEKAFAAIDRLVLGASPAEPVKPPFLVTAVSGPAPQAVAEGVSPLGGPEQLAELSRRAAAAVAPLAHALGRAVDQVVAAFSAWLNSLPPGELARVWELVEAHPFDETAGDLMPGAARQAARAAGLADGTPGGDIARRGIGLILKAFKEQAHARNRPGNRRTGRPRKAATAAVFELRYDRRDDREVPATVEFPDGTKYSGVIVVDDPEAGAAEAEGVRERAKAWFDGAAGGRGVEAEPVVVLSKVDAEDLRRGRSYHWENGAWVPNMGIPPAAVGDPADPKSQLGGGPSPAAHEPHAVDGGR